MLVLVGASIPGFDWSEAMRAYGDAEDQAVAREDLDAATEINLRMWVDGPSRGATDVDPGVRAAVARMQRRAFELQAPFWESDEAPLEPQLATRLGNVKAPTLVLVGDLDVDDIHRVAKTLATDIPGAKRATIAGAAHLPNMEQPSAFDELVLEFLAEVL
jgi:3-oxoadipate enol-lactonase